MKLGVLSLSLNVKDLISSKEFYEKLGFQKFAGDISMNYLIMKNGDSLIGLFEGMFENNIITFNPGWDANANVVDDYDDVRAIQNELKSKGIQMISEADQESEGPSSFMTQDPDGNIILFDQHV